MTPQLSILIPSRNEPYLQATIDGIFENSETQVEVLVGLDGYEESLTRRRGGTVHPWNKWNSEKCEWLNGDSLLTVKTSEPKGQRYVTTLLAEMARGKYLLKVDAHCSFGPGFDRILLETIEDDMILSPVMFPLNPETWTVNHHKKMSNFYFDRSMVMQFGEERPVSTHETMCLQGSAFMLTKDLYFELGLDDDSLGSWGSQGVELGCKAWFNGKRCMTTKETYYGHLFRVTDADFPYDRGLNPGKQANEKVKELYLNHPKMEWLVNKFGRPGDWSNPQLNRPIQG